MSAEIREQRSEVRQRMLLPYRLKREAAAREIMERATSDEDREMVARRIERICSSPDWYGAAGYEIVEVLSGPVTEGDRLVTELVQAARTVALFEQEWKFPHGFALVPRSHFAAFAAARETIAAGGAR